MNTLLIPTDGSQAAEQATKAAELAFEWAAAFEASIHGCYVVEEAFCNSAEIEAALESDGERAVSDLEALATDAGVPASTAVERGIPHDVIRRQAAENDADLVVLGTHGRSGIETEVLGSVSERTVQTAERAVLVV